MAMRLRKVIAWVYLVNKGRYTFVSRLIGQSHGELAYYFNRFALRRGFLVYRRDGTNFGHHEDLKGHQLICSTQELDTNGQKKKKVSQPSSSGARRLRR